MLFKNTLLLIYFLLLTNCTTVNLTHNTSEISFKNSFSNNGFALIYNDKLYNQGLISKKIDERSLIIFQKNLKTNTAVKVTNLLNNKSLIASVGKKSNYPSFNNSVLSLRIANELELNIEEPYVRIDAISENSMFIVGKTKTFDEEKNVATKAPVNNISISDLNGKKKDTIQISNKKFTYKIKIADFYFKDTALLMVDRIKLETLIKNPKIQQLSKDKYRVYLGPFNNIYSLQKSYNDINILQFDNIEIIKND
jgi:hypothetical protein